MKKECAHFLNGIAAMLRGHEFSQCRPKSIRINRREILDIAPPQHVWRESCGTLDEWFIRTCRAVGLHASVLPHKPDTFEIRETIDAIDEDQIAWPGKEGCL